MNPTRIAVGASTLAWAAAEVYNYISGQNAVLDLFDYYRFQRTSLEACVQHWRANRRRSDLIVCLTTIPSRIPHLEGTLKSLLLQHRAPQHVRLHLPPVSRREGVGYHLPDWLSRCEAVQVVSCEDLGPATKLLPALELPPRQPLLVVDDDMLYPAGMVDHFQRLALLYPNGAFGHSGWRVPADLTDRPTTLRSNLLKIPPTPVKCTRLTRPLEIDILQGYSGYFTRPEFLAAEVFDYSAAPEAAFFVDDVWLSGHFKVGKWVHPAPRYPFSSPALARFYKSTSLALVNRGDGSPERRNNTIVMKHLADRWLCRHVHFSVPSGSQA